MTSKKRNFVSKLFSSGKISKNKFRVEKIRERFSRKIEKIQRPIRKKTVRRDRPPIKKTSNSLYENFFDSRFTDRETFQNIDIFSVRRSRNGDRIYLSKKDFNNRNYFQNDDEESDDDRRYNYDFRDRTHRENNKDDLRFVSKNHRRFQTLTEKSIQTRHRKNENDEKFVFRKNRRFQTINSEKSLYRQHLRFKNKFRKFNRRESFQKTYHRDSRRIFFRRHIRRTFSYHKSRFRNRESENRNEKQKYERYESSLARYSQYERKKSRSRRRFSDTRRIKFKFSNVMKFNSKNTPVAFFIKRFQHIAEIESENAVFRVLPMCLKKSALK